MKANFINSIFKEGYTSQIKAVSFQPGQIFSGKILKLFPNNMAALQIGAQKIVAQLEAPLEAGKPYWFQVLSGEGKPRLKVLGGAAENGRNEMSHSGLLKELSVPVTEENKSIIRFFIKEQLPVSKEMFQLSADLFKGSGPSQMEMETLKLLLNKQLPLTSVSFQAVLGALNNESFSQLIETLSSLLQQHSSTAAENKLFNFLQSMNNQDTDIELSSVWQKNTENQQKQSQINAGQSFDRTVFVDFLKNIMQKMGFSYEQEIVQFLKHTHTENDMNSDALKPLLIDFLHENPSGTIQETADKILQKITGIQLLAQETGPIQQFAVQIPMLLGQKTVDLTMQWSGKKQANGQIDPAYCRVLFYMELQYLHETIVDMQVQNRVIKINVINENGHLKQIAGPFVPQLKENLQSMNFTLSAVQFTRPIDKRERDKTQAATSAIFDSSHYSGVDIRI